MVNIKKQRGIALITVVLIVVFITIASVSMRAHQQLDIRRTVNSLSHAQAVLYLRGAEYLSMTVLKEDAKDKSQIDTLDEDWATVLPPFPVEGGSIGGILEDLSGKFNINNLVKDGKKSPIDYKRFQNLLINLKLDGEIADAVVDWIDKDDNAESGGAEEGYYLSNEKQAYRTPNRVMTSISELLRVKGVDFKTYNKMKHFLTALPERNKININTADKEVLKMISLRISDTVVEEIIKGRDEKGYQDTSIISSNAVFNDINKAERDKLSVDLAVKSDFFLLTSTANIGHLEISMKTIFKRNKNKITILVRSQGDI